VDSNILEAFGAFISRVEVKAYLNSHSCYSGKVFQELKQNLQFHLPSIIY
jgi:hypothetical protein